MQVEGFVAGRQQARATTSHRDAPLGSPMRQHRFLPQSCRQTYRGPPWGRGGAAARPADTRSRLPARSARGAPERHRRRPLPPEPPGPRTPPPSLALSPGAGGAARHVSGRRRPAACEGGRWRRGAGCWRPGCSAGGWPSSPAAAPASARPSPPTCWR